MGLIDLTRTLVQVPTLLVLKKGMVPRPREERDCIAAQVERNAEVYAERVAVIFEEQQVTWFELNARSNQLAQSFVAQGLGNGDTASVIMENRVEFLCVFIALNKIGVTAALINTNLRGKPLTHCVSITGSKKCIYGEELNDALDDIKSELALREGEDYLFMPDAGVNPAPNWALDLAQMSADSSRENLSQTREVTLGDNALYIFTSGTTGMPKAAVLSNRRYLASAKLTHTALLKCTQEDRIYLCLPLYHTTGLMIGVGAAISSGAGMFIRRKFSASNFLREVREHKTSCLVYIGELCRYLMNTPEQSDDAKNPLKNIVGNGMRPDVWLEFKKRFGIDRVAEFYGASEGNVAFANLLNKDCTIGMTTARIALVKYDIDEDEIIRDENGFCIEVPFGEPGLLLGHINEKAVFEGYTDKAATEKKILRDAFEVGDAWFNSGDLLKEIDAGYTIGYPHYQFVDRVGDTFRWKSENVSTNEVGEIINGFEQVTFCNVYGVAVPNADGRAGMAALKIDTAGNFDVGSFSTYVNEHLPAYARPVFLRVQNEIDVTGTFKMVKGDLRKEAYDLKQIQDTLYVLKPGKSAYELLDLDFAEKITHGNAGF
jgi:citronellyl-CoA synthetase